jgi:hypothetical protein
MCCMLPMMDACMMQICLCRTRLLHCRVTCARAHMHDLLLCWRSNWRRPWMSCCCVSSGAAEMCGGSCGICCEEMRRDCRCRTDAFRMPRHRRSDECYISIRRQMPKVNILECHQCVTDRSRPVLSNLAGRCSSSTNSSGPMAGDAAKWLFHIRLPAIHM